MFLELASRQISTFVARQSFAVFPSWKGSILIHALAKVCSLASDLSLPKQRAHRHQQPVTLEFKRLKNSKSSINPKKRESGCGKKRNYHSVHVQYTKGILNRLWSTIFCLIASTYKPLKPIPLETLWRTFVISMQMRERPTVQ